ncbi:MAG: hypothetical protein IJC27_09035 [Lentisphaeria bacterium]|nr:hypothetical protein [Lentisphaeria bacterium]
MKKSLIVLCMIFWGSIAYGDSMREKLEALNYNFKAGKNCFLIEGGTNLVAVSEKPQRDIESNRVLYHIFTIWEPVFLSKEKLDRLVEFNKKNRFGQFSIFPAGMRFNICFGISVSPDVSLSELSKAIRECARVNVPIRINNEEQYKLSIVEVLDLDRKAGKAGGGHEAVAARMSKINISYCPQDFQDAYIRHIRAWKFRLGATEAGTALGGGDPGSAFVLGLLGAAIDAETQSEGISSTFNVVLKIAEQYGVDVRPYR